jgi:hypothetical protein
MSDEQQPDPQDDKGDQAGDQVAGQDDDQRAEPEWQRRRRLAGVFGDVLPDTTSDEREPADGQGDGESAGDRWLRDQVPPHHG